MRDEALGSSGRERNRVHPISFICILLDAIHSVCANGHYSCGRSLWLGMWGQVTFEDVKATQDKSCVTELTCVHCAAVYPGSSLVAADGVWMTCPKCGPADGILDVGYDFDRVRSGWKAKPLANRALNHW